MLVQQVIMKRMFVLFQLLLCESKIIWNIYEHFIISLVNLFFFYFFPMSVFYETHRGFLIYAVRLEGGRSAG